MRGKDERDREEENMRRYERIVKRRNEKKISEKRKDKREVI